MTRRLRERYHLDSHCLSINCRSKGKTALNSRRQVMRLVTSSFISPLLLRTMSRLSSGTVRRIHLVESIERIAGASLDPDETATLAFQRLSFRKCCKESEIHKATFLLFPGSSSTIFRLIRTIRCSKAQTSRGTRLQSRKRVLETVTAMEGARRWEELYRLCMKSTI